MSVALLVGCSSSNDVSPDVIGARTGAEAIVVSSATIEPRDTWGYGRARLAATDGDGRLVVITTTGLHRTEPDGTTIHLDALGTEARASAVATSADGMQIAVGFSTPPMLRVYDLDDGATVRSTEHALQAPVRSITQVAGGWIADTGAGPMLAVGGAAPAPLLDSETAGVSAVLPSGSTVVPLTGTDTIAIVGPDGTVTRHQVALADGASVLDVHAAPDGRAVGVSSGVGDNLFERQDAITVLDSTTLAVIGTVQTALPLEPTQWNLTDDAIVVADGAELQGYTHAGVSIDVANPADSSIGSLIPLPTGLVTAHSSGEITTRRSDLQEPLVSGAAIPFEFVGAGSGGDRVVSIDRFGTIVVTPAALEDPATVVDLFAPGELTDVAIGPGGGVAVASTDGRVRLLDTALDEQRRLQVGAGPSQVDAVSFAPTTDHVVAGVAQRVSETSFDDTILAWRPGEQTELFRAGGEREDVAGCSFFFGRVRFSPDGRLIAATSHDFSIEIRDAGTGELLHTIPGSNTVLDIAFTLDGRLVASYEDGMVRVWGGGDFSLDAEYPGPQGGYFALAMVPGTTGMATGDITGALSIVDVDTGVTTTVLAGADTRTGHIAASPDGSLIAAPTPDGVALWRASDGTLLARAGGHSGAVTGIAFAPDGTWVATASSDGTVRAWSVATS